MQTDKRLAPTGSATPSATDAAYSNKQAKRSFVQFLGGRVFSAVLGMGFLLLAVRVMSIADYGQYVTLTAMIEVFYLLSGFGLSFYVQRFLPDIRMKLTRDGFTRALSGLLVRRAVYTIVALVPVYWFAHRIAPAFDIRLDLFDVNMFLWIMFVTCMVRILDEILPSLLMQGPNQATLLLRSALRIVAVVACFHQRGTVSLAAMLGVELAANAAALIASLAYLWIFATGKSVQFGTENRYVYSKKTARDSLRYFAAQILGQCYSQSAVKLVIASTLGATGAAGYGFVQSITMTIYNYQPAIFLLGWIRPIVVSRYIRNNDPADAVAVVSIVFKVTLMLLAPLVCVFLVFGDLAGSVLSGGKHLGTGTLFVALTVVVILQGLHQLLSVLLMTFEDMKMLFRTTCLCGAASLVLWRLVPALESLGAALWLVFVETLWVVYVIQALVRSGRMGHGYSLLPYLRIVACALIVLLCAVCADLFGLSVVPAALVIVAATGAFVVCGIWSRPFVASEMHLIAGVLPNKVVRYFPGATQNIA